MYVSVAIEYANVSHARQINLVAIDLPLIHVGGRNSLASRGLATTLHRGILAIELILITRVRPG